MDWLTQMLAGAAGFMLAFFYSRTMKSADQSVNRHDCETIRAECRHHNELWRDEVLQRLERMESKMDRMAERMPAQC